MPIGRDIVVQLHVVCEADTYILTCSNLAGQALLCFHAAGSSLASDTQKHIAQGLKVKLDCLRVVLGDGQLLASICAAHPVATVEEVFHQTSSQ